MEVSNYIVGVMYHHVDASVSKDNTGHTTYSEQTKEPQSESHRGCKSGATCVDGRQPAKYFHASGYSDYHGGTSEVCNGVKV